MQGIIRERVFVYNQILQSQSIPFYEKNKKTIASSCSPIIFRKSQTNTYLLERTKQSLAFSCSPFIYERTKETFACSCSPIISRRRKKSKKHLPVQVKISHLNKTLLVHVKISHFKKRTKESLACSCSPPLPDPSSGSFASAQLDPSEEFQSEIPVQRERGLFGKNQFSDISFYWPHDQE